MGIEDKLKKEKLIDVKGTELAWFSFQINLQDKIWQNHEMKMKSIVRGA